MSRHAIHSKKVQEKRHRLFRLKMIASVFSVLAILSGSIYILRLPSLQIQGVEVEGKYPDLNDRIHAEMTQALSGNYVWLIPKKNIFVYPKGVMKNILATHFPEIEQQPSLHLLVLQSP